MSTHAATSGSALPGVARSQERARSLSPDRIDPYIVVVVLVAAVFTVVTGVWALVSPGSFADFADFPEHEHFLHDIGAFQIGLGVMLLLAIIWRDALSVALAAFLVANTIHMVNHWMDLDLGGAASTPWLLAGLSILAAVAFQRRLRQLGYVLGPVRSATTSALEPFVQQKTVSLTTYRRDGTPVATPVSLAVDGDRAVFRSFEKAWKTRRLAANPSVEVVPSRALGKPTGDRIEGRVRRLDGAEAREAARLLRRKHPVLHGVVVPFGHRAGRAKSGRTVHFELEPAEPAEQLE